MRKYAIGVLAAAAITVTTAAPAFAMGGEETVNIHYGNLRIKAWICNVYLTACDWRTETVVEDVENGGMMDEVTNTPPSRPTDWGSTV